MFAPLIVRLGQGNFLTRRCGWALEKLWIVLQGPFCPTLIRALNNEASRYQAVILFTYLYYPTLAAGHALKQKFVLVPTAHDELPFYFQHTASLLKRSSTILINVEPERELIEDRLGHTLQTIEKAGLGFAFDDHQEAIGHSQSVPVKPYVLYLGRQSQAKGVDVLIENFLRYVRQNPETQLKLVLLGRRDPGFEIPKHSSIQDYGHVSHELKMAMIRGSLCVVNPSNFESLSMIAIEAMACEKPLLLNQESAVLSFYCTHNSSCFGYRGADEFCQQLSIIASTNWSHPEHRQTLVEAKQWAEKNFSWQSVLNTYSRLVDGC